MSEEETARRFAERTTELGLSLSDRDRAALLKGWLGLQPQLERVRNGLTREHRPARPHIEDDAGREKSR